MTNKVLEDVSYNYIAGAYRLEDRVPRVIVLLSTLVVRRTREIGESEAQTLALSLTGVSTLNCKD